MSANPAIEQAHVLRALLGDGDTAALLGDLAVSGGPAQQALNQRGLQAYKAHGLALAERALTAAYPVVSQLIGPENFAELARYFWRQQPPSQGDVARWGATLADFLDAAPQLAGEPFLGDVARVEWALHRAATAADSQLDLASFAQLSGEHAEQATLCLSSGAALVASNYPVVSLVNAHLLGDPPLTEAAQRLQENLPENALVWRHGFKARVRGIDAAELALVTALLTGQPLSTCLGAAATAGTHAATAFDFSAWLTQAVQSGLVTGAQQARAHAT